MQVTVSGGRVVKNNAVLEIPLSFEDGILVDETSPAAREINASGLLVLPGIVDVHGDGFERQVQPRPKVTFPIDLALRETDRQMVSNGITTAFHGLTVSWEPGLRSFENGQVFVEQLRSTRSQLSCDTKLHIRWETFALDVVDRVLSWIPEEEDPVFAFNDHTTGFMLGSSMASKIATMASRSGMTEDEFKGLMSEIWNRRDDVPAEIDRAAGIASKHGAVLFAHDERTPEERLRFRELGAVTSEFPMTEETAQTARDAGEHTILGAPNVVRGGSHTGAMSAAPAAAKGLCSVLASDYYYPAPLHAAFILANSGQMTLPQAWALVSKNAAESVNLNDRGTLDAGKRADFILVDDSDAASPRLVACFVAGKKVYDCRN